MKGKILIADDNENNRKLLRVILNKSGYGTLEAENGLEAIKAAVKESPSLIVMDIRMPVMDGKEAIKRLKKDPATAKIPVIIMTSSAMKGEKERIMADTGCDIYATKPIELNSFLELINKYMER